MSLQVLIAVLVNFTTYSLLLVYFMSKFVFSIVESKSKYWLDLYSSLQESPQKVAL